jgi:hypothetical protein
MHLTLDFLLIDDPGSGVDKTGEWETQFEKRNGPKMKYPLKMIDHTVSKLDTNFSDPDIKEPVKRKKKKENGNLKVISISGKKNKDNKNKLF